MGNKSTKQKHNSKAEKKNQKNKIKSLEKPNKPKHIPPAKPSSQNDNNTPKLPTKYILTLAYIRCLERQYELIVCMPLEIINIVYSYHRKDFKTFIPIINAIQQIKAPCIQKHYKSNFFNKCTVNSKLNLLAIEGSKWFGCIDMKQLKVIFQQVTHCGYSRNTHNWFIKNGKQYLSLQTGSNTIKIFEVKGFQFKEDESLRLTIGTNDNIDFCEFDREFQHILIVYNQLIFQKRAMKNMNEILLQIELDAKLDNAAVRQLVLSDDGSVCAVAGGYGKPYFYLIDMVKKKLHKMTETELDQTYAPCFINGESEYVSVGGHNKLEIWDVGKRICFKSICMKNGGYISCSTSKNNILAIGAYDKMLRLFDVNNWEIFYSEKYELKALSLHFSDDLEYLTIGGGDGREKCVVLQIQ